MKNYLVTGGAGFIGSNFIRYMLRKYTDISIVNLDALTYAGNLENLGSIESDTRYLFAQGDICDTAFVKRIFETYNIDCVVHFAAESHVDRSILDPNLFARVNVLGTLNLMNAAMNAWKETSGGFRRNVKFVHISTDEVYGALGGEGFFTEQTPLDPHSPYAAGKASAQMFVKAYADTYQFPMNITCCSNNYGPYQFPEKMIPLMIHNCLERKELPVYGDGLQVRDWLYVDDHCKAVDMVAQKGILGEVYNIGGRNERRNIDIVKLIIKLIRQMTGEDVDETLIRHVTDRKGHDRRYAIDPRKIETELGYAPEYDFDNGIRMTIDWYLRNRDWMSRVVSGEYRSYYEKMYDGRGAYGKI